MDSVLILMLYILLIVPMPGQLNTYNADHFISALHSNNSTVQDNAVLALIEIGGPAIKPLIQALKDNDSSVRSNAAATLGAINDSRAVEP
jgi:HEAT repeat protein